MGLIIPGSWVRSPPALPPETRCDDRPIALAGSARRRPIAAVVGPADALGWLALHPAPHRPRRGVATSLHGPRPAVRRPAMTMPSPRHWSWVRARRGRRGRATRSPVTAQATARGTAADCSRPPGWGFRAGRRGARVADRPMATTRDADRTESPESALARYRETGDRRVRN